MTKRGWFWGDDLFLHSNFPHPITHTHTHTHTHLKNVLSPLLRWSLLGSLLLSLGLRGGTVQSFVWESFPSHQGDFALVLIRLWCGGASMLKSAALVSGPSRRETGVQLSVWERVPHMNFSLLFTCVN